MARTTLGHVAQALQEGRLSSQELMERSLAAISDPDGEGSRTFLHVNADTALAAARAVDKARAGGHPLPPFAGIPLSVKDLFDVEGEVTRAGSRVLENTAPAAKDAEVVARLRRAGFIVIGRTNMTEFAFSGLGLNPHFGTPAAPWDRASRRISGGSSSGAAVSVADGMCMAALGTDTGGSCRIPAAFTGLVGFKPTALRVPLEGSIPLSPSLDSAGPIANSVECCMALDAIMAQEGSSISAPPAVTRLRIAVVANYVTDDMDGIVAERFERAVARLSQAGATIIRLAIPALDHIPQINAMGGFAAVESYVWHRALLGARADAYDPRVRVRIERGQQQSTADYLDLVAARRMFIAEVGQAIASFDAMAMPTVPMVPPYMADLEDDDTYARVNLLALRNPSVTNLMDGCAISLPIGQSGEAPVGFSLCAPGGQDHHLLQVARVVERIFAVE